MKNHALERFRRPPEPLNCAQSVLYAYQKVSGDTSIPIADMKRFGGGRAPDGLCGALHAACSVVPEKSEQLKTSFAAVTGSMFCRELRKANEHPCEVCVTTSANLLESELKG
jgi:hypothetical protein